MATYGAFPSSLPSVGTLLSTDYVVVYVGDTFYKATIAQVWAAAEAANQFVQADFEDVGDEINTTGKFLGKRVFDVTSSTFVYASGTDPGDVWKSVATNATVYTPT